MMKATSEFAARCELRASSQKISRSPKLVARSLTQLLVLICLLLAIQSGYAQLNDDTTRVNRKRLNTLMIGGGAAYGITLVGLNELWYKGNGREAFHFFNDNAEWKQVDKIGHFYSSFYLTYATARALRWANVPPRKADIAAAITGFMLLVPVEVFDGFSPAYGASVGDLIADAAGPALYLGQTLAWNEIRIIPKFSFHRTSYAPLRPNVLGSDLTSEILKDYNGQTHWLSVDMDKFMPFPKWLNIAVGYGADGMVSARDNQNREAGYNPIRQYYFALDFDLTAIRTRSKAVKTLIFLANMIRLPAPAIEFSPNGTRFYSFYF
jgi:hypothetical protein